MDPHQDLIKYKNRNAFRPLKFAAERNLGDPIGANFFYVEDVKGGPDQSN